MLSVEEVESLRRSHAMAPLGTHHVDQLLAACDLYARTHREIAAALEQLRTSFPRVREIVGRMNRLTSSARDRLQLAVAVTALTEALEPVRSALNQLAKVAAAGTRAGTRS